MVREKIVMKALKVKEKDAKKIVEHLTKHDCLEWIDEYKKENHNNEPLVDVHYEKTFEDMIDWKFEDCMPSEMLDVPKNIEGYPEMLKLTDVVVFWYGLV
jgi:hypothetical protein